MGLRALARREVGYLKEDLASLRVRVHGPSMTPQRKVATLLIAGAVSVVYGLAMWAEPVAWVVGGAFLILGGFVLVDLDPPGRRRRRTAVPRKPR